MIQAPYQALQISVSLGKCMYYQGMLQQNDKLARLVNINATGRCVQLHRAVCVSALQTPAALAVHIRGCCSTSTSRHGTGARYSYCGDSQRDSAFCYDHAQV